MEPERARRTALVLAQPAADRWTPPEVSLPFFERYAGPKRLVMLEGAWRLPVEEPGVSQLIDAVAAASPA